MGAITQGQDIADPIILSSEQAIIFSILLFVVSFLLGSIPWGLIISKIFFKKDVRKEGSGNIGATNVMRTTGKRGGACVFVLDFGKGLLSGYLGYVLAGYLSQSGFAGASCVMALAFLGCVLGHIFSPFLKFKGGKGISAAIGALFIVFGPLGAIFELLVFLIVVIASGYVSLGSLFACVVAPFLALYLFWGNWLAVVFITIGALTIIWAHRGNIKRLRDGAENRFSLNRK